MSERELRERERKRERRERERIDNYFCHKSFSLVGFRERETNREREREREKERKERKWISYKLTEREQDIKKERHT